MKHIKAKKLLSIFVLAIYLFIGCGKKKEDAKDSRLTKEKPSVSKIIKKAKENVSITEKLKELIPITKEEMDSWMPSKIGVMDRSTITLDATPQMGIFLTKATFKEPSTNRQLDITIMDGAGEKGSKAISPYFNLENLYSNKEDNQGYQKLIRKNGMTIVQKYRKQNEKFDIEFAAKDRYAVKIVTVHLSEEELWEALDYFNFDKLKGI